MALSTIDSVFAGKTASLPLLGVRGLDVRAEHAGSLAGLAIDALLIVLTSVVTGFLYQRIALGIYGDLTVLLGTGASAAACFCAIARIAEVTDPLKVSSAVGRARLAVVAWMCTGFFLVALAFALKISAGFSRGAVLGFFFVGLAVVVASRVFVPRALAQWSERVAFRSVEPIIIAGAGAAEAAELSSEIERQGCRAVHMIGINDSCEADEWPAERRRVIAKTLAIAHAARRGAIYIAVPGFDRERLSGLIQGLRLLPRSVRVLPDPAFAQLLRYSVRTIGSSIAVEMQREPLTITQRRVKRILDVTIASLAIGVLLPAFLAIALLIKLDSPGPVFFRQSRNGLGGRCFRIFKFRTMSVMEDGEEICQAVAADGRVTRLGRFLRCTSIDELPQLLNVVLGEMSLVGPRPHARAHDRHYAALIENYEIRQHVKPGLTGWAQVNGYRGETPTVESMHHRIELDLWYAANASLALDFLILLRTLPAFLGQRNAY